MKYGFKSFFDFFTQLGEVQIPAFAAYSSFFEVLAVFPIIMLLLSLVKLTPLTENDLLSMINELSPVVLKPLLTNVSEDLFAKTSNTVLGVSAVTLIWSASRCMIGLINGLNSVYRVDESRNFIIKRLIAFFYMMLFIAMLAILLMFHVFWKFVLALAEASLEVSLPNLLTIFRYIVMLALLTLLFMLVFKVFPNRKAGFKQQFPGALLASVGWMGFTFLFTLYVNHFSNYSLLYGSLTTLVLVMLWMYFCMMILFVGGAVNAYLEKNRISTNNI